MSHALPSSSLQQRTIQRPQLLPLSATSARMSVPGKPIRDITGVILAGGQARRMGGQDKGLIEVNGRAMVDYVVSALRPQVGELIINANRYLDEYAAVGNCPVVQDHGYAGPLAGVASAMSHSRTRFVLVVPCDSPLIAPDLAARLYLALDENQADISAAHDGERLQPVFALINRALAPSVLDYLDKGHRKIDTWYESERLTIADFSDRPSMFLNINTPHERDQLERALMEQA